jgi:glyoxylase-like metal-dependent hydrolase (beta-lactamase superfamily II)
MIEEKGMTQDQSPAQLTASDDRSPRVHRFDQRVPFPVNAYIIEGRRSLVVIDGLMTVTASRTLRRKIDELAKPLKAVLVTHSHPDHYAGLSNIVRPGTPVFAAAGVADVIREDDALKDSIVRPMFGDEWPQNRIFPSQIARENERLEFDDDLAFDMIDIGPGESRHDSIFLLHAPGHPAFIGDVVYSFMHAYMADGKIDEWRQALERVRALVSDDTVLYVGHGAPVTTACLTWQRNYLDTFEAAMKAANWSDAKGAETSVVATMKGFLPTDDLIFLMQLSIGPMARKFGLI